MNTRMQEEVVVGGATSGTIKLWDLDQVVCLMCMPYVYALCVCLIGVPYVYALCVCLYAAPSNSGIWIRLCALCVCLMCMPYVYAL